MSPETRRIRITMRKPWFALHWAVKPTIVIAGRGHPIQWGVGTWQVPTGEHVAIRAFLFNRMWRFGRAEIVVAPDAEAIEYCAPALPFLRGRFRVSG